MASRTSAILGPKYIVNDYFTLVLQAWAFYLIKNYSRCEVQWQKVCIMPVVWDSALCSADKHTKWTHLSPWLVLHCYTHYNVENSIICKFIGVQGAFVNVGCCVTFPECREPSVYISGRHCSSESQKCTKQFQKRSCAFSLTVIEIWQWATGLTEQRLKG